MNDHRQSMLILGFALDGETFRLSNWAERLCGVGASVQPQGSLHYHPGLDPVHHQGMTTVRIHPQIRDHNPDLWEQVMGFAKQHNLQVFDPTIPHHIFQHQIRPTTSRYFTQTMRFFIEPKL